MIEIIKEANRNDEVEKHPIQNGDLARRVKQQTSQLDSRLVLIMESKKQEEQHE